MKKLLMIAAFCALPGFAFAEQSANIKKETTLMPAPENKAHAKVKDTKTSPVKSNNKSLKK